MIDAIKTLISSKIVCDQNNPHEACLYASGLFWCFVSIHEL